MLETHSTTRWQQELKQRLTGQVLKVWKLWTGVGGEILQEVVIPGRKRGRREE